MSLSRKKDLDPAAAAEMLAAIVQHQIRQRFVRAAGAAVLTAGGVAMAFSHSDLPNLEPNTRQGQTVVVGDAPVQANNLPKINLNPTTTTAPATTTTTTTPPATSAAPGAPAQAAPAGAHDEPGPAAQAWFAHRAGVRPEQVHVGADRLSHDRFLVLVSAWKGPKLHSAWVHVDRVGGNYWRVSTMLPGQGEG